MRCSTGREETSKPVDQYLDDWAASPEGVHLLLLGDSGAGKSTAVKRFAHRLAVRFLEGSPDARIPLFVSLGDCSPIGSLEALLVQELSDRYGVRIKDPRILRELNDAGCFTLILDGFDELALAQSYEDALESLRESDRLSSVGAKVVLTCRTGYFPDQENVDLLHESTPVDDLVDRRHGYEVAILQPLGPDDVRTYLTRASASQGGAWLRDSQQVHDLADLPRRPLLLKMLADVASEALIEQREPPSATALYELATETWLKRDVTRGYLSAAERRRFAEELALMMSEKDAQSIGVNELPRFVSGLFGTDPSTLEATTAEFRTCSFLVTDLKGGCSFAHRSLFEFFLAKRLFRAAQDGESHVWGKSEYDTIVLGFVAGLAAANGKTSRIEALLKYDPPEKRGKTETHAIHRNACIVLGCVGDQESAPLIVELLQQRGIGAKARWRALEALGLIGSPEGIPIAVRHLTTDTSPGVQVVAARALGQMGAGGSPLEALEALENAVRNDPNPPVKREAAIALGRLSSERFGRLDSDLHVDQQTRIAIREAGQGLRGGN